MHVYQVSLAYLCDFFDLLNALNLKLQGKDSDLIAHSDCINRFIAKLALWSRRLNEGAIDAFHNVSVTFGDRKLHTDLRSDIAEHLYYVKIEFGKYFSDLSGDDQWIKVTRNPFLRQVEEVPTAAQEEFLQLIYDHAAKDSFDRMELGSFWLQMKYRYPLLSEAALKLNTVFNNLPMRSGIFPDVVIKTKTGK